MESENNRPETIGPEVIEPEVVGIEEIEPEVVITETSRTDTSEPRIVEAVDLDPEEAETIAAGFGAEETMTAGSESGEAKKKGLKPLIIALTLVLIAAAAGYWFYTNSDGYKYKKLIAAAEEQYKAGNYDQVLDLYEQGLEVGYDRDDLLARIKDIYYAMVLKAGSGDTGINGTLLLFDQMGERFPDLAPDAESWTAEYLGNVMKEGLKQGVQPSIDLYKNIIGRYYESDLICGSVDEAFRPGLRSLIEQKIKEYADSIVEPGILSEDYENMFAAMSASDLRADCHYATLYVDFPVVVDTAGGQKFGVHYDNGYFSLYYGEYDENGKRSGKGSHIYLKIDKDDPNIYIDEIVTGEFKDDNANGRFVQYIYSTNNLSNPRFARFEGEMKDNRYYRDLTGDLTDKYGKEDSVTYKDFRFIFDGAGHPVVQGTRDGKPIIGLAPDPENGDTTYTASEASLQTTYGMMPFCGSII